MSASFLKFVGSDGSAYWRAAGKKPILAQLSDLARLSVRYRWPPYHYFRHELYAAGAGGNVLDYLPPRLVNQFVNDINPLASLIETEDKVRFFRIAEAHGLPTVPCLAIVDRKTGVETMDGEPVSFRALVERLRNAGHSSLFVKPVDGYSGRGAATAAIATDGIAIRGRTVRSLDELNAALFIGEKFSRFLIQPRVRQHAILERLNPTSVNTIRIDNLILDDNQNATNGALLRLGSGRTETDNWAGGGILVPIDLESGRLHAVGMTKPGPDGGGRFRQHPVTGHAFAGVVLPHWEEVRALARNAAAALKPLRYVAWDISLTEEGPLIIESNATTPDFFMLQQAVGGLRETPIGRAALARNKARGWRGLVRDMSNPSRVKAARAAR
jgi:hypothetical protein